MNWNGGQYAHQQRARWRRGGIGTVRTTALTGNVVQTAGGKFASTTKRADPLGGVAILIAYLYHGVRAPR